MTRVTVVILCVCLSVYYNKISRTAVSVAKVKAFTFKNQNDLESRRVESCKLKAVFVEIGRIKHLASRPHLFLNAQIRARITWSVVYLMVDKCT